MANVMTYNDMVIGAHGGNVNIDIEAYVIVLMSPCCCYVVISGIFTQET